MSDKLKEIQTAIDNFQMDEARRLVGEELQDNPSAEGYYLASQAAANHGQRVRFLEKTLELDPFHQTAYDELASMMPPSMTASAVPTPSLKRKPKAKNMPAYPLATIGKRFLAMLIDAIILGVIGGVYGMLLGPTLPDYMTLDNLFLEEFLQFQMSTLVVSLLINAVYHIFFMTRTNGQTPGKQALGIRVIKKDGTPITFIDALLRNVIGYALSGMLALGYIWALFDSEKQGWHDKIAGTVVVVDEPQSKQS